MMLYPKPKSKKKKRIRKPKPTIQDRCIICGKPYAELHEVFHGTANRRISQIHGMQVRLCENHHRGKDGVHSNAKFDLYLKQQYQRKFEEQHGHEKFMKEFGRNYLDERTEKETE